MNYEELVASTEESIENIISVLAGGRVPFLQGSPGIGKSDIIKEVANHYNLEIIDIRLSQVEPTELLGFPFVDGDRCNYKPLKYFPLQGDTPPKGKVGWLVFFDELNSASRDTQAAAYRILLDREIGTNKLSDKCYLVAAGNLSTDKAIVNKLSSALQSRLVHLFVKPCVENWLDWAAKQDIDYRVLGFLNQRKDLFWKFDPNSQDVTYPCPRTWHMLSDIIKNRDNLNNLLKVLCGTVGQGPAIEFKAFSDLAGNLPTLEQVLRDPINCPVPGSSGESYYMVALLAHNMSKDNWQSIIDYAKRMTSKELLVVLFRLALKGKNAKDLLACAGLIKEAGNYVKQFKL